MCDVANKRKYVAIFYYPLIDQFHRQPLILTLTKTVRLVLPFIIQEWLAGWTDFEESSRHPRSRTYRQFFTRKTRVNIFSLNI